MTTRTLYILAALVEGATGVALMVAPAIVTALLLGASVSGVGIPLGRVAGIALVSLALACWPSNGDARGRTPGVRALLFYNLLVTLFLLVLGVSGESVGKLLWPAVAVHALMTLLLARAWFSQDLPA